ncbi:unnamed protein product [Cyprideis torosa]|uniref:Uncharacterized protein n=1 Tax=Cyprideis torosa TaxID=163714 RepID=A0A7R8WGR8_9CRUS|nr:unnamed protein product [Cyprideis torosa]CAG0895640.1 unnamed protein product [Cyprideis torosa]
MLLSGMHDLTGMITEKADDESTQSDLQAAVLDRATGLYELVVAFERITRPDKSTEELAKVKEDFHDKVIVPFSKYMGETFGGTGDKLNKVKGVGKVEYHCHGDVKGCEGDKPDDDSLPLKADFRVSDREGGYPYVIGPGGCGQPGAYIYFPYLMFEKLKKDGTDPADHDPTWTLFGQPHKVLFSLWISYRYGVPPDIGCYGHYWFPETVEAFELNDKMERDPVKEDPYLRLNASDQNGKEMVDDGAAPDAYPSDGWYSAYYYVTAKDKVEVKVAMQVMSMKQPVYVYPASLTRPGLIPHKDHPGATEKYSKFTVCDLEDLTNKSDVVDRFWQLKDGRCLFQSSEKTHLCKFEHPDDEKACDSKENTKDEKYMKLESNWCKSRKKEAQMLIFRSEDEFHDVKSMLDVDRYWLGGHRKTVRDDQNNLYFTTELMKYDVPGERCAMSTFQWADPEEKFMFTDNNNNESIEADCSDGKDIWLNGNPDNVNEQNHLAMGYRGSATMDDENWGAGRAKAFVLCTYQGRYDWYYPSRSVYRCGSAPDENSQFPGDYLDYITASCPVDMKEKIETKKIPIINSTESRIFACKFDGKPPFNESYALISTFSGKDLKTKTVAPRENLLFPPKVLKFEVKEDKETRQKKATTNLVKKFMAQMEVLLPIREKDWDPDASSFFQLTCDDTVENLRKVVIEGGPPRFEKVHEVNPTDYQDIYPTAVFDLDLTKWFESNTAAVCTLRTLADKKGTKKSGPSNIFTAFLPGYCMLPSIHGDKNLVVEPKRGLIKPEQKVKIKCTRNSMVLSCDKQTNAAALGCGGGKDTCLPKGEALELTCGNESKYSNYEVEKEKKPTCTEVTFNGDCKGRECVCESIQVVPPAKDVVECKDGKCAISGTAEDKYMQAPDENFVISKDCGKPKPISGTEVTYTKNPGDKDGGDTTNGAKATYKCFEGTFGSGNPTQEIECQYDTTAKRVQWTKAKYQKCTVRKIGDNCDPNNEECPSNTVCKDDTKTCECGQGWDTATAKNGEKFCRYQKCFWDESFEDDDGTYDQRPPISVGQSIEFHCKPGYYFQQNPNPPSDSVKVQCKVAKEHWPRPIMVPQPLKCKEKKIGNPCKDDSECAASSVFGTVCKVPAGSSKGTCECKDTLQQTNDICECTKNDTVCQTCADPPEWDGTELDPPFPDRPNPTEDPKPGPYTVKCKDGKVLGNEIIEEVQIQCIDKQWRPITKGSTGTLNFDCKEVGYNSSCKPGTGNVCEKGSNLECDGTLGKCMCAAGSCQKDGKCEPNPKKCDPSTFAGELNVGGPKDIPNGNADKGAVNTGYLFDCGDNQVIKDIGTQTLKFMCRCASDSEQPTWSNDPGAFFPGGKKKECVSKPAAVGADCKGFKDDGDFMCDQSLPLTHCDSGTGTCQCLLHAKENDDKSGCTPIVCEAMHPSAEVEFLANGSLDDMGHPYSDGAEKFCRYQKCFWDESFEDDDGTYDQRPPISVGQSIEFHCKPGYYFQQNPNPPSDSVKVQCKVAKEHWPRPIMVPQPLKCKEKKIGNTCKDDSECAASSVFGTVCKVPAGSSEKKCECKDTLQQTNDICECKQDDKDCQRCADPPEWDGTELDPPFPPRPNPTEDPKPGPYTVKCKDGKVLGNEIIEEVQIQCIDKQWRPITKGSTGTLNFDCKEVGYNSSCKPGPDNVCEKGSNLECDGTLGKCMCKGGFSHKDGKCEKDDKKCDPKKTEKIKEGKLDGGPKDIPHPNKNEGGVNTGFLFDCGDKVIEGIGTQTLKFMCRYDSDPKQPTWSNDPDAFFPPPLKEKKCVTKPEKVGEKGNCKEFGENGDFMCDQSLPFTYCKNETDDDGGTCDCMPHTENKDGPGCTPVVCEAMHPSAEVEFLANGSLDDMGHPYSDGSVITIKCPDGKLLQDTVVNTMTGTCNNGTWTPPDFLKHNPEICVPEKCEVDQMNKTCVNGYTIGKGKEGHNFHCKCKKDFYTPGGSTVQSVKCRYNEVDRKNYFYKGSNRVERFDKCQLLRDDPIFTQCYFLTKHIIGYEVDDKGYPHRYSKMAYATLGWANAHMLISVCAWPGIGIYLYRLGVL